MDPHHFSADPDSGFHLNADPKPIFHFNADSDPDPTHHRSHANLRPSRSLFWASTPPLWASTALHGSRKSHLPGRICVALIYKNKIIMNQQILEIDTFPASSYFENETRNRQCSTDLVYVYSYNLNSFWVWIRERWNASFSLMENLTASCTGLHWLCFITQYSIHIMHLIVSHWKWRK